MSSCVLLFQQDSIETGKTQLSVVCYSHDKDENMFFWF